MTQSILTISQPGVDVRQAHGSQILFTTQYPFMKFDALNPQSFQTVQLTFNNEPPQPGGLDKYTNTSLFSFQHGYNYIPSVWMQWQNTDPVIDQTPSSGNSATSYYPFSDDTVNQVILDALYGTISNASAAPLAQVIYNDSGAYIPMTDASLYVNADTSNVYLNLVKTCTGTLNGNVLPVNVTNIRINIRIYVFCEPALGESAT